MALSNDSILVTPGSGATVATHLANAKEHQVMMLAASDGQLVGTQDVYSLFMPPQSVAANRVYFDLFNATGSGKVLRLVSVRVGAALHVAVTGTLAVNLYLTKTSTVGTGGTAFTADGSELTTLVISRPDTATPTLPAQVTSRLLPSGGWTAGAVLAFSSVFTEETNAGASLHAGNGANIWPSDGYDLVIRENEGLRLVQGTVASVGNVWCRALFIAV